MLSMLFILHAPVTVLGLIGLWWRSEQINLLQMHPPDFYVFPEGCGLNTIQRMISTQVLGKVSFATAGFCRLVFLL
jgi:hypothetical protein